MQFSISNYQPPGPVAASFIRSELEVPFIMGPAGGGKTMATIFKILRCVALMPACRDGVVRAKVIVVRTDYRTLYRTTLSSWFRWFPKDYPGGKFTGGADRPATHELKFVTPRGRRIEIFVEFAALGEHRIEDMMRGWEGTIAWLNEADLLDESALNFIYQRGARWPSRDMLEGGVSLPRRIFGDLNPPGHPKHWIVLRFLGGKKPDETGDDKGPKRENIRLFQQPSGLSPNAENVKNLPDGYYQGMLDTLPEWDVQRFVHGKVGYDRSGKPVYPEFDATFNLAPVPIKPIPGQSIYLGLDISGLHPGAVIVQRAPNLQLRVLEEFYAGRIGATRFAEIIVAALQARYRECFLERGFYDPSNDYGADKEGGEQSTIDIMRKALGCSLVPAPTNEVPVRIEAVRNQLIYPLSAQSRGLIVTPDRCPMLVEGFMSFYRFKLNPDGSVQNADSPRPEKNEHSNVQDALQYVVLGLVGLAGVISGAAKGARPGRIGAQGGGNTVAKTAVDV